MTTCVNMVDIVPNGLQCMAFVELCVCVSNRTSLRQSSITTTNNTNFYTHADAGTKAIIQLKINVDDDNNVNINNKWKTFQLFYILSVCVCVHFVVNSTVFDFSFI